MRILLAPDKFKGTFTAAEVCEHLRAGIAEADPTIEVVSRPMADGGDGTLEILLGALGGERIPVAASGPLGEGLTAHVGRLPDGAVVVESALFCGLELLPPNDRNPMRTTTYGLGVALREVFSWNPARVLVGLGGSATVDGGLGMARALGFTITSAAGTRLPGTGGDLAAVQALGAPASRPLPPGCSAEALCDVAAVLTGPDGAAARFGPQKGASPEDVASLDAGLGRLGLLMERDLGVTVADVPGSGAAGGLGAGLMGFLGFRLVSGARKVIDLIGLESEIRTADIIVTGEGRYDATTRLGKASSVIVAAARHHQVPVVVVCGTADEGSEAEAITIQRGGTVMGASDLRKAGKLLVTQGFWRSGSAKPG